MITNIEEFLKNEKETKETTEKSKISDYARIVSAIDQGLPLTREFVEEFIAKENADLIVCLLNYAKLKEINITLDQSNLLGLLHKSISSNSHHLLKIVLTENEKSNHLETEDLETALFDTVSACENYNGIALVRLLAEKLNLQNIDLVTGYPLWALYVMCSKQPEITLILKEMISEKDFLLVTDRFPGILNAWCSRFFNLSKLAYCESLIVPFLNRSLVTLGNILKLGGPKLVDEQGQSALVKIADQLPFESDVKKYALEFADILLRYGACGQEAMETAMRTNFFEMINLLEKNGIVASENAINEFISDLRRDHEEEVEEGNGRGRIDPRVKYRNGIHFYTVKMVSDQVAHFISLDHKDFARSLKYAHFLNHGWAEKNFTALGKLLASGMMPYGKCDDDHRELLNRAVKMFVAVGWNPSQCRGLEHIAKYADDFEIPKTEHRRYIDGILLNCANIGDIETINLMLETGLRFRGDKEIASLERIIEVAKKQGHTNVEKLLIPLLEPAKKIQQALISYNKKKSEGMHENWFEEQMEMRLKLFNAIAKNDQNEIIRLVSIGANLNFGGLYASVHSCAEFFSIGIGGAWESIDRVHPLYFACTRTMDENTCISIFQLLIDLGANIHSANEFSLMRCGYDVKNLVRRLDDKDLLHRHIIFTELKQENTCKRKEFVPLQKLQQQELKAQKEALTQADSRKFLLI